MRWAFAEAIAMMGAEVSSLVPQEDTQVFYSFFHFNSKGSQVCVRPNSLDQKC